MQNAVRAAVVHRVTGLAKEVIRNELPQVIYATSPPPEALLLADHLGKEFGIPVVCDLRDPWTYSCHARYRHILDFCHERRLERRLLNRAAAVIANTPTARTLLLKVVGVSPSRMVTIPNGYDERRV